MDTYAGGCSAALGNHGGTIPMVTTANDGEEGSMEKDDFGDKHNVGLRLILADWVEQCEKCDMDTTMIKANQLPNAVNTVGSHHNNLILEIATRGAGRSRDPQHT